MTSKSSFILARETWGKGDSDWNCCRPEGNLNLRGPKNVINIKGNGKCSSTPEGHGSCRRPETVGRERREGSLVDFLTTDVFESRLSILRSLKISNLLCFPSFRGIWRKQFIYDGHLVSSLDDTEWESVRRRLFRPTVD